MKHPRFVEQEVRLIGHRWSPAVHELKRFLARSRVRYRWFDHAEDDGRRLAASLGIDADERPVVILPDGRVLVDPTVESLAEHLGLPTDPAGTVYDFIVVGGGPAGLSASIYAASEGLHTVVVDQDVPGGQISYSAMVENYPGFPQTLDGTDLAQRMVRQAERFGVEIVVSRHATRLRAEGLERRVTLDDGTELKGHTVLLALGVSFRWLENPGLASLVGAGVYYGAATVEASICRNQEIYVLGGGNSAAQGALFLATVARAVHLVTRSGSLDESMSRYLIERIERTSNIVVHLNTTVTDAGGTGHLEWLELCDTTSGETRRVPAYALFVFVGAAPRSEWLDGTLDRDEKGFLLSGVDYLRDAAPSWPLARQPYLLETTMPGVFAAGDVRRGSVKRMTVAVGEGAMAVQFVHDYLRETPGISDPRTDQPFAASSMDSSVVSSASPRISSR